MKQIVNFLSSIVILSVLLAFSCPAGTNKDDGSSNGGATGTTTPAKLYAIGDIGPSGIGKVFYITDGGLHGLEAAPNDQLIVQTWIAGGSTQTTFNGNTNSGIGTGLANSNAIIAQAGHTGSAAYLCRDYNGAALRDWFLPSKDELHQLYKHNGVVGIYSNYYLSSTESDSNYAWGQLFSNGSQVEISKIDTANIRIRAVRSF